MTQLCLPRTSLLHGPFRMKSLLRALLTLLVLVLLCYTFSLSTTNSANWKLQNIPAKIAAGRESGGLRSGKADNDVARDERTYYRLSDRKQSSNIKFVEKFKGERKRPSNISLNEKKKHQSLGFQREAVVPENSFASGLKYNDASASESAGPSHSFDNRSKGVGDDFPEHVGASHDGGLLSPGRKTLDAGESSPPSAGTFREVLRSNPLLNGLKQSHTVERKTGVKKETLQGLPTGKLRPSTIDNGQEQGGPMAALKGKHRHLLPVDVNGVRNLKESSHKEHDAMTAEGDLKLRRSGESLPVSSPHFASPAPNASEATISAGDHDAAKSTLRLPFDLARRAWAPWRSDTSCRRLTVHFTRGAPPRALASYPGSGNTWARYLLEAASGIHSGSVYQDDQLFLNGYRGEMEPWSAGTTLVQKVHEYSSQLVQSFQGRAVLLLRNPYRAILSFHNFLFGGHKGYAPVANYRRKDWDTFLHMQMKAWLLTAMAWLQEGSSLHVLHYEDLLQDPAPHLEQLLKDIGAPTDPERLGCIKKHSSGQFQRSKEYLPDDLKVFSKPIREKIDRAIRYVDFLLQQRHLRPLPLPLYEFYNLTLSDKIVRVPCPKDKTVDECDYYVDNLNRESKRHASSTSPPPTDAPEEDIPPPPPLPRGAGDDTQPTPLEDTRLTILERLSQNSLTDALTDVFMDFLEPYSENPLRAMVKNPNLKAFLGKPVHFEGAHGHEAEQLARDYIWPLGAKGFKESLLKEDSAPKEEPR